MYQIYIRVWSVYVCVHVQLPTVDSCGGNANGKFRGLPQGVGPTTATQLIQLKASSFIRCLLPKKKLTNLVLRSYVPHVATRVKLEEKRERKRKYPLARSKSIDRTTAAGQCRLLVSCNMHVSTNCALHTYIQIYIYIFI